MTNNNEKNKIIPVPNGIIKEKTEQKSEKKIGIEEGMEKELEEKEATVPNIKNQKEWLNSIGWEVNPFIFNIDPSLFVGYEDQRERILNILNEKHKISLILGPTGSGKTTLLKWLSDNLPENYDFLYIAKPPRRSNEFVDIFNEKFKRPWYLRFIPNIKNIHQIPNFLNKKLKNKSLVVMFDEAHESETDVLEWLRVLSDNVENMVVLVSALPVFRNQVRENLETFEKRIMHKIEVLSLTKEETKDLINKRIESVGGSGLGPFSEDIIELIYDRTGGFPREIIRLCNDLVKKSVRKRATEITRELITEKKEVTAPSLDALDELTPMQKEVIKLLGRDPMAPGEIANSLNLEKYKSRQHAVRSVNNILKRLMQDGFVEREGKEKTFVYRLSPKIRTLVVRA